MWNIFVENSGREIHPSTIGLIVGAAAGLPSAIWAAITGETMPVFAGSATGIAGVLYWVWKQPEDRKEKLLAEAVAAMTMELSNLRAELQQERGARDVSERKAIDDRTKLRVENEELKIQLARIGAGVNRVETLVANPTITPDPDKNGGRP